MKLTNIMITGTGSFVPERVVTNQDFAKNKFYDTGGAAFEATHEEIAEKFKAITGIEERRYVEDDLVASDIGAIAGRRAIEDAGIDPGNHRSGNCGAQFWRCKSQYDPNGYSA